MAVEGKRGCGYRKIGGTYLEDDPGLQFECGRIPLALAPCPLCEQRPKFTRGLQRIVPKNVLHSAPACRAEGTLRCGLCPFNLIFSQEQAALMWVGSKFYTPEEFQAEAKSMGVSKRIPFVPKWFKVNQTWVFLAHEEAVQQTCTACDGKGHTVQTEQALEKVGAMGFTNPGDLIAVEACETCEGSGVVHVPAIFYAYKPARVVRIVPDTMPAQERAALQEQGLTLVEVPHDDPDHQPSKRKTDEE